MGGREGEREGGREGEEERGGQGSESTRELNQEILKPNLNASSETRTKLVIVIATSVKWLTAALP